jgi:hypothetical protein
VLVLPKVLFFALGALGIVLIHAFKSKNRRIVVLFIAGAVIPIMVMFLLFFKYGDVQKALYLVTKIASDSTAVLGKKFPREADLIFRPNGAYYGLEWYNLAWKMNLFVWVFACVWSIKKLISFLDEKDFSSSLTTLLFAFIFWSNFLMYVVFVPLKHPQYLIPMTPFVAYYFSDFLRHFVHFLKKHAFAGITSSAIFLLFFGLIFPFYGAWEMYNVKLKWKNDDHIKYYTNLYSYLPAGEPVFDLSGETVFYPEGYYFCCIPYGQYEEALTFKYPDLEAELRRKEVKFVHIQDKGRIGVLPPRQQKVVSDYYIPHPTRVTSSIYVSGVIIKSLYNYQEINFDLIAGGSYVLLWQGVRAVSPGLEAWVKIDGVPVISNPVQLTAGSHTITIAGTGEMTIRYEW